MFSLAFAVLTMPVTRSKRWKGFTTEETFSHHVLPAANKVCHPHKILTGGETELNLDMVQEVKCVAVKHTEALAGYPYEVVNTFFVNSRCRSWAAPFSIDVPLIARA